MRKGNGVSRTPINGVGLCNAVFYYHAYTQSLESIGVYARVCTQPMGVTAHETGKWLFSVLMMITINDRIHCSSRSCC